MKSIQDSNVIFRPSVGDDCLKIFLSNLDGRIDTQDLHTFFSPFGTIEHIESWTPKSAIILFSDIQSIDRVLSKYRKCVINKQEIFIRRFRYGYIERAYMDSTILFIKPISNHVSPQWNDRTIRHCFHDYATHIEQIRVASKSLHAFIHFKDYDLVDRILLQANMFSIDGIRIEMKRAKCHDKQMEETELFIKRLLKENKVLKKQIERQENDFHRERKSLKRKLNQLHHFESRHRYSNDDYKH